MTTHKRPQNCGTSYCSCIECVMEPDYKALWEQMCERCDELDKKLAQLEHSATHGEPVGEVVDALHDAFKCSFTKVLPVGTKLYTTPPPVPEEHKRNPLTDEQRREILKDNTIQGYQGEYFDACGIIDDVEAAHGIKE